MGELNTTNPAALRFLMNEDLYLVDPVQGVQGSAAEGSSPAFDYLGENNRYLLLLVHIPQQKNLPSQEMDALINTLKAKKMSLYDVALLNIAHYPSATFDNLKDFFVCKTLVLLGVAPQQIQLQKVALNSITAIDNVTVLATYSFAEMLADTDKKRAFWNEMKKL